MSNLHDKQYGTSHKQPINTTLYSFTERHCMAQQVTGCSQLMAGVSPPLAVFILLLIGALLGAAAGTGLMWWRHRRQMRYLQPASPRQTFYDPSPQVRFHTTCFS